MSVLKRGDTYYLVIFALFSGADNMAQPVFLWAPRRPIRSSPCVMRRSSAIGFFSTIWKTLRYRLKYSRTHFFYFFLFKSSIVSDLICIFFVFNTSVIHYFLCILNLNGWNVRQAVTYKCNSPFNVKVRYFLMIVLILDF